MVRVSRSVYSLLAFIRSLVCFLQASIALFPIAPGRTLCNWQSQTTDGWQRNHLARKKIGSSAGHRLASLGRASAVLFAFGLAFCSTAFATAGVTVAGVQSQIVATNGVTWHGPVGVATDSSGNIYIAQCDGDQIVKIDATTHATTVLPLGSYSVKYPQQLAMDSSNNLYIADFGNNRVLKYSTTSSTITATYPVSLEPFGIAVDASGNIWVGGSGTTVSKISANAPSGTSATTIIGAGLSYVAGITFDRSNNLWVSDRDANAVYEYTASSSYESRTTIFSNLNGPCQLFFDSSANLYVAEKASNAVYKFPYSNGYSTSTAIPLSVNVPEAETVAEDAKGNFFVTTWGNGIPADSFVIEISTEAASFGTQSVGTTSAATSFNLNVSAGTTISSFKVLDQGSTGLEFNLATSGTTCTTGMYSAATACVVQVTFTPQYPGKRLGAVEVLDDSNILATAYIAGTGTGPLAAFATTNSQGDYIPSNQISLTPPSGGFVNPTGVTVDAAGNVFVADWSNQAVYEIPATGGTTRQLGGRLTDAAGVAVDGAGNTFIAQGADGVSEIVAVNGSIPATPTINSLGMGHINAGRFYYPVGVAVDGSGNVFVADEGTANGSSQAVYEIEAVNGSVSSSSTLRTLGSGFNRPTGVAVDAAGNVFVANAGVSGSGAAVYEIEAVNGSIPASNPTIKTLGSGFVGPTGVAVDAAGNVFVADSAVYEIEAVNGSIPANDPTIKTLGSGPFARGVVALAGNGNVFVGNGATVYELDYADAPTLSYTNPTVVGATDTIDGTKSLRVQNIGNETLTISGLVAPTDFAQVAGSGTPLDCAANGTVAAGTSCNLSIEFAPAQTATLGLLSESFTLTDNNLNATTEPGTQQSIALSGTATASDATATALTVSANTVLSGGTVTLTATVTDTTNGSNTPTGTVTFTDTLSNTLGNCTLVAGACTTSVETLLGAGTDTITATYGGASGFASSSGTGAVAITPNSAVKAPTASYPVTMTIATAGTVASIKVVTEGAAGLDFADAGSDTCAMQAYTVSQSCTVNVTFTPEYPGPRYGAVLLEDASGNLLATSYLYGVGLAPEVNFSPGVESTVVSSANSLGNPQGLALDGNGNLYTADIANHAVLRTTPSGITTKVLDMSSASFGSHGHGTPESIAVDGAGNLYIGDSNNNQILKESPTESGYAQTVVGSGLDSPSGAGVDQYGNVYIANTNANQILKETLQADGSYVQSAIVDSNVSVLGRALSSPFNVAVDGSGNVYIADTVNNRVIKESYSGGSYTPSLVVGNLDWPIQVAVDGNGNVYFSNYGWNNVSKGGVFKSILAGGSYGAAMPIATLPNSAHIFGIAVDGGGKVYFSDVTDKKVFEEDFQTPATSVFGATVEYVLDNLDNPRHLQMYNFGNQTLTFATPSSGTNGGITGGAGSFAFDSGTSCPEITSSGSATGGTVSSLAANSSCNYEIDFTPQAIGAINGTLTLTDNNLNVASAVQTAALLGTGTGTAPITFISPSSKTLDAGTVGTPYSQAFTASGGTSPYTYTSSSESLPAGLTLSSAGVLSGTPTTAGSSYSLTVTATDQYSKSGSQTYTLVISKATPTVSASAWPTASAITYGQTLASSTLSGGTGSVPGSFAFTTTTTTPAVGTAAQSVTFTPTDSTDYSSVTGTVSVTVNKATPTVSASAWPTASAITYGQTLASSTLSGGTGSVPGSFAFTTTTTTPAVGTAAQSVTFTPADSTDYSSVTGTVSVTVNKATPTVSPSAWPTASAITYGQTLASSTLSGGTGSVAGSFAFTTTTTTPAVGAAAQSVTFTPTDSTDYSSVTGTVSVTVNKATPTISASAWPTASAITYGQTLASSTLSGGTGSVAGSFAFTTTTTTPAVGTAAQSVTFTPADSTDYSSVTGTVSVTVNKATPTVSASAWPTASAITYGQTLASSTLSGGTGSVAGSFAFTTTTTTPGVGAAAQSVTFTPTDSTDYSSVTGTVSVTVLDFSLSAGSSSSGGTTQTALPGGTATYALDILPSGSTILPVPVTLTVSGMPTGATATITPSAWTQLTSTSWSFPANTPLTNISLSIQLPSARSSLNQKDMPSRKLPLVFLGILLLPFVGRMRRTGRRLSRLLSILLLLIAGMTAMAGVSGCGSSTGFFAQAQKSYTVTATATAGTLSHSTTIMLTVE